MGELFSTVSNVARLDLTLFSIIVNSILEACGLHWGIGDVQISWLKFFLDKGIRTHFLKFDRRFCFSAFLKPVDLFTVRYSLLRLALVIWRTSSSSGASSMLSSIWETCSYHPFLHVRTHLTTSSIWHSSQMCLLLFRSLRVFSVIARSTISVMDNILLVSVASDFIPAANVNTDLIYAALTTHWCVTVLLDGCC